MSGTISGMNTNGVTTLQSNFIPGFMTSGSMDDLLDHFAETRFGVFKISLQSAVFAKSVIDSSRT